MPELEPAIVVEPDIGAIGGGEGVVRLRSAIRTGSGSFPPNETTETLLARFERPGALSMYDSGNDSFTFFDIQDVARQVVVIYWLRRASPMWSLVPVFGDSCREVVRRYPGSEDWAIYGDFPGEGLTSSQRRRSSNDMVTAWRDYFNLAPGLHNPPDDEFAVKLLNPSSGNMFRLKGTVGKVVAFSEWAATQ